MSYHPILSTLRFICKIALFLVLLTGTAFSQSNPSSFNTQQGSPAGSYPLSGFETVNPFSGNLNFSLPLIGVAGRGSEQTSANLTIDAKWTVEATDDGLGNYYYTPTFDAQTWWVNQKNSYSPGLLIGRQEGGGSTDCYNYYGYSSSLTRLKFITQDGTEYDLRDQATGGRPFSYSTCPLNPFSRGTVFVTADGTAATFISDQPIHDAGYYSVDNQIYPSGYLMMRDATRYRIDGGGITWIRDRNGNKLTFIYGGGGVAKITDSLNREVTFEYNVSDVAPYGLCDIRGLH